MAITYQINNVKFESVIYEDELIPFRDYLQQKAGENIEFDFVDCDDIHLAILQLIIAYKKNYNCEFRFADEEKIYVKVLKGFHPSENNCN